MGILEWCMSNRSPSPPMPAAPAAPCSAVSSRSGIANDLARGAPARKRGRRLPCRIREGDHHQCNRTGATLSSAPTFQPHSRHSSHRLAASFALPPCSKALAHSSVKKERKSFAGISRACERNKHLSRRLHVVESKQRRPLHGPPTYSAKAGHYMARPHIEDGPAKAGHCMS